MPKNRTYLLQEFSDRFAPNQFESDVQIKGKYPSFMSRYFNEHHYKNNLNFLFSAPKERLEGHRSTDKLNL